jgi:hypothetical protein
MCKTNFTKSLDELYQQRSFNGTKERCERGKEIATESDLFKDLNKAFAVQMEEHCDFHVPYPPGMLNKTHHNLGRSGGWPNLYGDQVNRMKKYVVMKEHLMAEYLFKHRGTLATALSVDNQNYFRTYKSGVLGVHSTGKNSSTNRSYDPRDDDKDGKGQSAASCQASVNHAVSIVGYGVEEIPITDPDTGHENLHKVPYWMIKNSWGPRWGDNGYVKIGRQIPLFNKNYEDHQISMFNCDFGENAPESRLGLDWKCINHWNCKDYGCVDDHNCRIDWWQEPAQWAIRFSAFGVASWTTAVTKVSLYDPSQDNPANDIVFQ